MAFKSISAPDPETFWKEIIEETATVGLVKKNRKTTLSVSCKKQVLGYRREWFMKRKTKTLLKAIAVLLAAGGVSGFLTKNSMHVHDTIH